MGCVCGGGGGNFTDLQFGGRVVLRKPTGWGIFELGILEDPERPIITQDFPV